MRARFGKLPLADLLAPAIFYADDGFPVTDVIAERWDGLAAKLLGEPATPRRRICPTDARRSAGEVFSNPDLAGTLRLIARRAAPDSTKARPPTRSSRSSREKRRHDDAPRISRSSSRNGSMPISTTYRGWTVYELPPNTQGIAALMMLNMMEQFPLGEYGLHSAEGDARDDRSEEARLRRHAALRRRSAVREGARSPRCSARRSAKSARGSIDPAKARVRASSRRVAGLTDSSGGDTIYLSVIDRDGNIVSLIQSIYFGVRQRRRPAGHRLHAAQPRRAVHARGRPPERARAAQAAAAHDHSRRSWRRAT